jgi:NADH:ubiquinone oxidoreductase subunit
MGATFGTKLFTRFHGVKVGGDGFGNAYYREKKPPEGQREKRWVIYGGEAEVPPEWQGWLTHTVSETPIESPPVERPWLKPHQTNRTGSAEAYRPPGALLEGGRREQATGDYEPWVPD